MKKTFKLFAAYLVLVLGAGAAGDEAVSANVVIYYLPFGVETYVPVTIDTIEKEAWFLFEGKTASPNIMKIRTLLALDHKTPSLAPNQKFDGQRVRLNLRGLYTKDIFVDAVGTVLFRNKTHQISAESKSELDILLKTLGRNLGKNQMTN